jgi:uncharacterized protein (DUF2252 family)
MAHDLAKTPSTGVRVQVCGDCHLLNFGLFASVERRLVFDINDFDETLPAPWEWDLKRLSASVVVGARDVGFSDRKARDLVDACVRAYRGAIREFSHMSPLDVWYTVTDIEALIAKARGAATRRKSGPSRKKLARMSLSTCFPNSPPKSAVDLGLSIAHH